MNLLDQESTDISSPAIVARQPICDRNQKTFAYELLFRRPSDGLAIIDDPDRATAQVILNSFMDIGLDRVARGSKVFINVTRDFVLANHCRSLPKDRVVLEILEDTVPDRQFLAAVDSLKTAGYRFALDDYTFDDKMLPLIPYCSYVKVDVRRLDPNGIARKLDTLRRFPVTLLAEKVETLEEFEFYKEAQFEYFQGYFFCRPKILTSARVSPSRTTVCRLLAKLYQPDATIQDIERVVGKDLALSYQLLRYINSACLALPKQIESVGHAVRLVGMEHIRILASLMMLASVEGKPRELMTVGLVRGRMCELLAQRLQRENTEPYFTTGLFSTLDAFLDTTMESALKLLPLSDEICAALLNYQGQIGVILRLVHAYERGEWKALETIAAEPNAVGETYVQAVEYAENLLQQLRDI